MRRRVTRIARFARVLAIVAFLLALAAAALAACDSSNESDVAVASGDDAFGIEVTLTVRGNGRVTSEPASLDCPSSCFLRVAGANHDFDGSDLGLTLSALPGSGYHFAGWSAQPFVSGVRANGPADCSPMTRNAIGPPIGPTDDTIVLPYGATQGTPPAGREIECAPYTAVPVAYSLVATFEQDAPGPFEQEDASAPGAVLFEPPVLGTVVAREIGVHGNTLYFRYDQNGVSSGIAAGAKDGASPLKLVAQSNTPYSIVSIGRHLAVEDENFVIMSMNLDTLATGQQDFGIGCAGLTTDDTTVYCRWQNSGGASSYLYTSLVASSAYLSYTFTLPAGNAIAVDDTNLYFSETPPGTPVGIPAQLPGRIERTLKQSDAGYGIVADASPFAAGLTDPIDLVLSPTKLFWLDKLSNDQTLDFAPTSGLEAGTITSQATLDTTKSFVAIDPSDPETFYVGGSGNSIQRGRTSTPFSLESFRTNVVGLGGIAVDDTYVYWTQTDGRVYRTRKDQAQ